MRRNVLRNWDLPSNGVTAALIIVAAVFFVGGLAGCILARQAGGEGETALNCYLDGFISVIMSGELNRPPFVSLLWKAIRWPLLVFFCGFTPIGLIGVPVLFLIRAFLLSFSISSFFRVLGAKGLLFAFSIFGISGLICIPVLFVLGIQSFLNAGSVIGQISGEHRRSTNLKRPDIICYSVCFLIIFLCTFIEFSVGDLILKASAEMLN